MQSLQNEARRAHVRFQERSILSSPNSRYQFIKTNYHYSYISLKQIKNLQLHTLNAVVYTIEFQKRGLPHAHILLWLEGDFKNPTSSDIDKIISAELPDKETDPEAYSLVEQHMMHGPCGKDRPSSPCMDNGVCTKKFPRSFVPHTQINESGYVLYRRRQSFQIHNKRCGQSSVCYP